jgi:hypothetical protein
MKTITLIACFAAAAAFAGCATTDYPAPTQPPQMTAQPSPEALCKTLSTTFADIYTAVIPIGENCLRHAAGSDACLAFAAALQMMADTEIHDGMVFCLSTGRLSEEQARRDGHVELMDRLAEIMQQATARRVRL